MTDVTIKSAKNGPYLVKGPVTITASDGTVLQKSDGNVTLCRCGHSSNKPFCDSTHKTVGFESDVTADEG